MKKIYLFTEFSNSMFYKVAKQYLEYNLVNAVLFTTVMFYVSIFDTMAQLTEHSQRQVFTAEEEQYISELQYAILNKQRYDKSSCKEIIFNYYQLYKNKTSISKNSNERFQNAICKCIRTYPNNDYNDFQKTKNMLQILKFQSDVENYQLKEINYIMPEMPTINGFRKQNYPLPQTQTSSIYLNLNNRNWSSNDSIFNFISRMGNDYRSDSDYFNTNSAYNHFDFRTKPIKLNKTLASLVEEKDNAFNLKEYRRLVSFIKGIDSLKHLIDYLKSSIAAYPLMDCELDGVNDRDRNIQKEVYYMLMRTKTIYLLNSEEEVSQLYKLYNRHFKNGTLSLLRSSKYIIYINENDYSKSDSRWLNVLNEMVRNNQLFTLDSDIKEQFITEVTNLNNDYFIWQRTLSQYEDILDKTLKTFYINSIGSQYEHKTGLQLDAKYNRLNYVGAILNNGLPNGPGFVLTQDGKFLFSAYWDQGFPITLYELNIYHYSKGSAKDYIYIPPIKNNKYPNHYVRISTTNNGDSSGHNIYIGQFKIENNYRSRDGFGACFYDGNKSSDKLFYIGEYKDNKWNGIGSYVDLEGNQYDGVYMGYFEEDNRGYFKLTNGTCIYPNGDYYIGEFNMRHKHGRGTLFAKGGNIIQDGYFANNEFIQTVEDYEKEEQRKLEESNRLAEEQGRIEAERRRKEAEEKEKSSFDLNKVKWKYINNSNLQCECNWCGKRFRGRRLSEFEIILQKAGLAYCFKSKEDPVLAPMMTDVDCSEIKMYKCDQFCSKKCEYEFSNK